MTGPCCHRCRASAAGAGAIRRLGRRWCGLWCFIDHLVETKRRVEARGRLGRQLAARLRQAFPAATLTRRSLVVQMVGGDSDTSTPHLVRADLWFRLPGSEAEYQWHVDEHPNLTVLYIPRSGIAVLRDHSRKEAA